MGGVPGLGVWIDPDLIPLAAWGPTATRWPGGVFRGVKSAEVMCPSESHIKRPIKNKKKIVKMR